MPTRHRKSHSNAGCHDRSTSHQDHRDRHRFNRLRSHSHSHRYRNHRAIHGVTPGHTTDAHTKAHLAIETQACIAIDETPHIEDPHHTEVFLPIPEIAVDPYPTHHTKQLHNIIKTVLQLQQDSLEKQG